MEHPKYNLPDEIYVSQNEKKLLLNLAEQERCDGAFAFGVFGGRTLNDRNDIDVIIVKEGVQRGGITFRNGIFHLNYFPANYLSDPIATFGKQAFTSAVFIFNYL